MGGFLIWTRPSQSVLSWISPSFWYCPVFFGNIPDVSLSSESAYGKEQQATSLKAPGTQSGPVPQNSETTVWETSRLKFSQKIAPDFPPGPPRCCALNVLGKFDPLILFLCECRQEREGCYCSRTSWQQSCSVVAQALACNKC